MTARRIIRDKPYYKGVTPELGSPSSRERGCTYEPGKTVVADSLDVNPAQECSHGIFFCGTIAEALHWGPRVVAVHPVGQIIDTGTKLRAAAVKVVEEVVLARANLAGANLDGANLAGANLADAYLARANLAGANLADAKGNRYTTLPAGWKVGDSGLIVRSK
jgi:hypothetical protein